MRPINQGTEKNLLYREWVEANRAYVDKISGGRLGYVHMNDMSEVDGHRDDDTAPQCASFVRHRSSSF